jgi:YVTN family beta-propeller protein
MAILLAAAAVGCGSNSTAVGITISPAGPLTIIVNETQQLSATVTGIATTTVYWQICLPAASTTVQPTVCTPVPGVTLSGQTLLTGYGTITQNGLYTAPSEIPAKNSFVVMASSTAQTTTYNIVTVSVDTGVRVQINPTFAVIGTGETFQFTATVTGTTNSAVTWQANGTTGGDSTDGYICPNPQAPIQPCSPGEYEAPVTTSSSSVTLSAVSAADPSQSASATITVAPAVIPVLTSVDPAIVAEGSAQQDVYLTGSSFFSTSTILVNAVPVPTIFVNRILLRGTIPASLLMQAGNFPVEVQSQNGGLSSTTGSPVTISVVSVRPAIVASTPDSVSQSTSDFSVNLTGGYFLPGKTTATFNGSPVAGTNYVDSRHLTVTVSSASTPGLYPIVLENCETPTSCVPAISAVNLAVTPNPGNIPTSPIATMGVGSNPSAVAVDPALGLAVVANQGSGTVSLIDLNSNQLAGTVTVGNAPTGVAIDDQLPHHLALVVNSTDETVSTIDLATQAVTSVLPVSIGPLATSPVPYSIGINPMTHRGIVTYQSTNQALVIDLVTSNPGFTPPCTGPPCPVALIGGSYNQYATGMKPAVAVDPSANWALTTPGGSGMINLVDLGRAPDGSAGDQGRVPQVIGNLSVSQTVQGVGLNLATHQALLTDPSGGKLTSYSLLDNTVNTISFTQNGTTLSEIGFVAAAANPLENIGIAINAQSAQAAVVDLETGNVLETVSTESGANSAPQAVAMDPGTNEAVIANQDGTVSILSLGPIRSPQIVEVNPSITYTSPTPLTLSITGAGFVSGASVFLDGIPISAVTTSSRQIVATVPANMLSIARRYAVTVENPGQTPTTNAADLAVIQAIPVGNIPVGVAVDTDRDVAVVTNSADNDVSVVALTPTTLVPGGPIWPIGPIESPISVGTDPLGVAVLPRTGSAVVANFESNNASIVDVSGINATGANPASIAVPLCSACYGPTGVGMNQDSGIAVLTNSTSTTYTGNYYTSFINVSTDSNSSNLIVDQLPTAVATDPNLSTSGVAAIVSSQTNTLDLVDMTSGTITRASDLSSLPAGIVFDSLNQVFLVAASLGNNIVVVDPSTDIEIPFHVGTNPTSVDYNFQTSTIVTVNSASQTMSVVDYVCPPSGSTTVCSPPRTRMVLGVAGSEVSSSLPVGPNSVAIDPKLNLAVLVDTTNNRILLIPLPH